jgi:hypothetical protein
VVCHAIAFDDVEISAMKIARRVKPGFVVDVTHVDEQGVAIPSPA